MKKIFVIIALLFFVFVQSWAIYPTSPKDSPDTVFIHNGVVVGKVIDIKRNRVLVKANNDNTQVISLREVQRIAFSRNFVPQVLLGETIKYKGKQYTGRVLYIDLVHSDVLFYDAQQRSLMRFPLLETSLASKPVKKLYQSSFYISIFFALSSVIEVALKVFTTVNVYLIAAALLFLFSLIMFLIFGLPWIRHKKANR